MLTAFFAALVVLFKKTTGSLVGTKKRGGLQLYLPLPCHGTSACAMEQEGSEASVVHRV